MDTREWFESASRGGLVCAEYVRKMSYASTKEDVFRVLCDANGGAWLFGLHAKGVPMPVDGFLREFAAFLDGGRAMEYPQGYTSKFYCRHAGCIEADATLVYLLECAGASVRVPKNGYPSVILSKGSSADIVLDEGARLNVELYGDARANVAGDLSRVRTTRHLEE